MTQLDQKFKDVYTGKPIPAQTVDDLEDWLRASYATLMPEQERCIIRLCAELRDGNDPAWWAAACNITAETKKKRGARK